jgi:AraC-like DNA-binding protein
VTSRFGRTHTVPVAVALPVLELVRRWHVQPTDLLSAAGLTPSDVEDPLARMDVTTLCQLLENARTLTGEPGIGYYLGLHKRVSMFGYLGFVAQSARTLREALALTVKYAPLVSSSLSLELQLDSRSSWLVIEEQASFGSARDISLISTMLGLQTIRGTLTGHRPLARLEFAFEQPEYYPRFAHVAPDTAFGQPFNRIAIDPRTLDLPIVSADPTALQVVRRLCERELDELGFDTELVERVRQALPRRDGGYRSLEEVAAALHVSPRTLKRRLGSENASFSDLLDRERKKAAVAMLSNPRIGLDVVAHRLDYSSVSTLIRAFHRWTGQTPSAFRRGRRRRPALV